MTNIIMEVKQITKNIGKRPIIHESSFQLEQGKIYGFIGPNGAGKTTVMRIMHFYTFFSSIFQNCA